MPKVNSSGRGRRGFSLVELLVVISIVAVLFALVLPVISKARALAQATICASNLRQQSVLVHAYAMDQRNQAMPMTVRWSAAWMVRMSPYLGWPYKSQYDDVTSARYTTDGRLSGWASDKEGPDRTYAVFTCPTTKLFPFPGYWGRSYGYNLVLTSGREELTNLTQRANAWAERRTLQSITWKPSNIVLTADSYISAFMGVADFDASIVHATGGRVHENMKVNMQFVDGHVAGVAKGERLDISFRDYLPTSSPGWP